MIATRASPKLLGLFRGVIFELQELHPTVLATDLSRVERHYRARGFYSAKVRAARVIRDVRGNVRVSIDVLEGPPVTISSLTLAGLEPLPDPIRAAAHAALARHLRVAGRFEEGAFAAAAAAVKRTLQDSGYAHAVVERRARVDVPRGQALLRFDVQPGVPAVFGEIEYVGLGDFPPEEVARVVGIAPGQPYSSSALEDGQRAVAGLGVFSSVQVEPLPPSADAESIPVAVTVRRAPLHTLTGGVGMRLDSVRTDVHVLGRWEHENFLGGLRRLVLEANPSLVFLGTRLPELRLPAQLLPQLELSADLRQPAFFEARTTGLIRAQYSISAVLNRNTAGGSTVLGYRQTQGGVGVDRSFGRHGYARVTQNLQLSTPFAYIGVLDPEVDDTLLITYFEVLAGADHRDNAVNPRSGYTWSFQPQVAGPFGEARDVRLSNELRGYWPLGSRTTLALRGRLGLSFPLNYDQPDPDAPRAERLRDAQLVFFRGFYSGGSNSNRGYPQNGIGPHAVADFFPRPIDVEANVCTSASPPESCKSPVGGLSMWELSAELRVDVSGPLRLNVFCDASDVAREQLALRFDRPHLSCGPGLRLETPLGPVRADIGARVPGLQALGGERVEGAPPTLFGLPITVAVGLGEAF